MIQNTANKPLSELFSTDNEISYYIPKYQREYVWGKNNWESMFDDIEESDGGHFLGSIICINTQSDSLKPGELELVDGQQRMTTISLFYLAIYQFLLENNPDVDDMDILVELSSLKKKITLRKNELRLTPSYSNHNFDDYKWIFSEVIKEIKASKKPRFLGLRQIARAYNYFYKRLTEISDDEYKNPKYTFESVKTLLTKLNSATLVKIDVATHADAFTLFETLNNRGVPLSAIDLIKNKLLGHLEKIDKTTSLDDNFDRWNALINNLTDEYKVQERFLRQFYNAFHLDSFIKVEKKPKALRSNLITIYEELINKDVNKFFDRLESASLIYSKHIQYELDEHEHSEKMIRALRNLENVNGIDGFMLLLFVDTKFEITELEKIELINLLCNYSIRRNVTDTPPTRDITNYFMDIIDEINKIDSYSYSKIREFIIEKGKPASDVLFEEKLKGNLYDENVGATRYILSSIELSETETREVYSNFYSRDKKKFVWTIEHVFPQGENIPQHWVDMVANGDNKDADEIRKEYVHKLGNLTLTGYNSQLSNKPLKDKQEKKKDGKNVGFRNGLFLNEQLKDASMWTKTDIENRTDMLVEKAIELFKL